MLQTGFLCVLHRHPKRHLVQVLPKQNLAIRCRRRRRGPRGDVSYEASEEEDQSRRRELSPRQSSLNDPVVDTRGDVEDVEAGRRRRRRSFQRIDAVDEIVEIVNRTRGVGRARRPGDRGRSDEEGEEVVEVVAPTSTSRHSSSRGLFSLPLFCRSSSSSSSPSASLSQRETTVSRSPPPPLYPRLRIILEGLPFVISKCQTRGRRKCTVFLPTPTPTLSSLSRSLSLLFSPTRPFTFLPPPSSPSSSSSSLLRSFFTKKRE